MRFAAVTDIGLHRKRNEDQYWIDADQGIFAVCDGMGGHRGGDVASQLAVDILAQRRPSATPDRVVADLLDSIRKANQTIYGQGHSDPSLYEMGTTLTAAAICAGQMTVAHVGDSRLYRFREGRLTQITRDHTLAEKMLQEGLVTAHEAGYNQYKHVLTRAVGIDPQVEVDIVQSEVKADDWILLGTDGLTDMVEDTAIAGVLDHAREPGETARELVEMALQKGGSDNITVILISI
jgi:PPM family protein phosphatase